MIQNIVETAKAKKTITPKGKKNTKRNIIKFIIYFLNTFFLRHTLFSFSELKHMYNLHCVSRTLRRCLNSFGRYGRVAASEYDYKPEQLAQRKTFGEG